MPIRSMTGFGSARAMLGGGDFSVDVRSVNQRHLEVRLHLPPAWMCLEPQLVRRIKERLARGRIEVGVRAETPTGDLTGVHVDRGLLREYRRALDALADELALPRPKPDVWALAQLPGVVAVAARHWRDDELWQALQPALDGALDRLVQTREQEGAHLAADITARLEALAAVLARLTARLPDVRRLASERLQRRLSELPAAIEPQWLNGRVESELALLVDRLDVTEEAVRIGSHLAAFREALAGSEPCGKRLEFLAMELGREFNTIGSKSQDAEMSAGVVEAKCEIERIREQIMNVE